MKKTTSETWPRLTEERIKLPWLKIDFDKFMVEGESEEEASTEGVRLNKVVAGSASCCFCSSCWGEEASGGDKCTF